MPTVVIFGKVRIAVLTRDEHEPPHVHVEHPDGTVVVTLDEITRRVTLRSRSRGVKTSDVRSIIDVVWQHFDACLDTWKRYNR